MSWITFDNLKRFWKGIRTNPVTFTGEIDLQNTTRYKGKEIATKADVEAGGSNITVDDALSDTSTNPVQNKVINAALNTKAGMYALESGYGILVIGVRDTESDYSYLGFGAAFLDRNNAAPVFIQGDYITILATEDYVKSAIAAIASYDDTAF